MPRFDVLAIGELNPDLIVSGIAADGPAAGTEQMFSGMDLTLGSSTAIACVLMQRLGMKTAMVAVVGDDEHGRFCTETLEREGVDVSAVRVSPTAPTGITLSLAYPQDRLLLTRHGTMTELRCDMISNDMLMSARHVHVGSFFIQTGLQPGLRDLFARARRLGLTTSLDTGWDPTDKWPEEPLRQVLAETDVFLPNESEFARIAGPDRAAGLRKLHAWGVGEVLVKLGAAGSLLSSTAGVMTHEGFPARVVDTTGAGDSCNAGYLAARLDGLEPPERLAMANACGALTVGAVGGTGGVRNRAQVESFLAGRG